MCLNDLLIPPNESFICSNDLLTRPSEVFFYLATLRRRYDAKEKVSFFFMIVFYKWLVM